MITNPFNDLNLDNSSNILGAFQGLSKTDGGNPVRLDSLSSLSQTSNPGFTPLEYYDNGSQLKIDTSKMEKIDTSQRYIKSQQAFYKSDFFTEEFRFNLNNPLDFRYEVNDILNPDNVDTSRLSTFVETPYENNDPIIHGFEVIINTETSPLFNGSIDTFIESFSEGGQFGYVSEISSRKQVLEEFKQQFFKFFKSTTPDTISDSITSASFSSVDTNLSNSYLGFYLKKISGLENLIESNTPDKSKSFIDYNKDTIKLSFSEDISLSMGSLAYLYKLLSWSRINGKQLIPPNLLRFDCSIIVSEMRNYSRVVRAIDGSLGVDIIKDNLSRYVYNLYECQFFFDKFPHDGDIDMSQVKFYDLYEMMFDYKYSTYKFERWNPPYPGQYAVLNNDRLNPFGKRSNDSSNAQIDDNGIKPYDSVQNNLLIDSFNVSGGDFFNPVEINEKFIHDNGDSANTDSHGEYIDNNLTNRVDGEEKSKPLSRRQKRKNNLENFKKNSKKESLNISNDLKNKMLSKKTDQQTRKSSFKKTLSKVDNFLGTDVQNFGRNFTSDFKQSAVYELSKILPIQKPLGTVPGYYNNYRSAQFFFDVRNSIKQFSGNQIMSQIPFKF